MIKTTPVSTPLTTDTGNHGTGWEAAGRQIAPMLGSYSAAVVTGILIVSGRGKDGPFERRYRYTDTWAADKKGWVMIASQDYEIPRR